mmetsp:Transcript_16754/g.28494  ORF Transcript_16754/g.28494 Transcript_16754/m.28494 type:complete len:510 (+) Transcript_16754:147-1676(+)
MSSTEKCAKEKVRWKYSAPFEPFSYWETLGHGYEYCEAMDEFQKQFTEAVNEMRRRKKGADVIFNYPLFDHSRTSDTIIFHDEALLPHWREVALALEINAEKLNKSLPSSKREEESFLDRLFDASQKEAYLKKLPRVFKGQLGSRRATGSQFVMDKVELRKDVIDIIGPHLKLNPFESIRFEDNLLDRDGALFAIDILKQISSVVKFYLIGSEVATEEDLSVLLQVIRDHPSLRELELKRCVGSNIKSVTLNSIVPMCKGLKSLNLSGNNISTDGSAAIADCLATNPSLQELFLRGNKFNDDDAEVIADALKTNTNLWKLDLKDNEIGRRGCNALFKAIFDHDSLNSAASSNHTCDIFVSRYKIPIVNGFIVCGEDGAIQAKKFALIAPPNDNFVDIHLLSTTPPVLMHMLLEFVQNYPPIAGWHFIQELYRGKSTLEYGAYTRFGVTEERAREREQEEREGHFSAPQFDSKEEKERKEAAGIKRVQIKSLNVLMSVVKGVVVPMFFSA